MTRGLLLAFASCLLLGCDQEVTEPGNNHPASRLVTLAPQLTELVFAAGAGGTLVGVSAYSDYPPEARSIPVVSDAFTVDQEQLALLHPDLLIAWQSGTPAHVVEELRRAGYTVEVLRTRSLGDIAPAIRRLGELTGHQEHAAAVAAEFANALQDLRSRYADGEPVSVFFQISERPLYTVSNQHYIGEIINLCGGRNIFAGLSELAPAVAVEAVVDRNPEVLLAAGDDAVATFAVWQRWPAIDANRYGNLFVVNPDEISRAGTRITAGARSICEKLEIARKQRSSVSADSEQPVAP